MDSSCHVCIFQLNPCMLFALLLTSGEIVQYQPRASYGGARLKTCLRTSFIQFPVDRRHHMMMTPLQMELALQACKSRLILAKWIARCRCWMEAFKDWRAPGPSRSSVASIRLKRHSLSTHKFRSARITGQISSCKDSLSSGTRAMANGVSVFMRKNCEWKTTCGRSRDQTWCVTWLHLGGKNVKTLGMGRRTR